MFDPESEPPTLGHMFKCYGKLVLPMTFSNMFSQLIFLVNTLFAGHMGKNDQFSLAAVGIGESVSHMCILSVMIGLNVTQETLTS